MFDNSTFNSTHSDILVPYYGKIPWTAAFSLQFVMAMMGNFLIVWIVFRDNRLRTTTNHLITNMAVSDIIAAIFAYPDEILFIHFGRQWLIGGVIGNALCKLVFFTIDTSFAVSAYSCVVIAVDRYFAVAHPFKRPFQGKMKHVIAVIWIISIVIGSPYLFILSTIQFDDFLYCDASYDHQSLFLLHSYIIEVLTGVLPVLFITITYILTICKLYQHKVTGLSTTEQRRREQQNKKVLKHAVTIVVLLYFCRVCRFTLFMFATQGKLSNLSLSTFLKVHFSSDFIFYFNLMYNFFIYLIFNDIYRENIKALIPKCCCRSNRTGRKYEVEEHTASTELKERHRNEHSIITK